MATRNTLLLILALLTVQLLVVPPADAGVKQFFKDAVTKVKSLFNCASHESDDDHMNAINKDGSVNTIEGIGETVDGGTTPYPKIDLRNQDPDAEFVDINLEPRIVINPPSNCQAGQRKDPAGICRDIY